MRVPPVDRRAFLTVAGAASVWPSRARGSGEGPGPSGRIRLGGPIFVQSDDPEVLVVAGRIGLGS